MERTSKRMCEKENNWLTTVQALQSMKNIFQLLIELNRQELKLNPMNETCHYHPGRPLRTSYTTVFSPYYMVPHYGRMSPWAYNGDRRRKTGIVNDRIFPVHGRKRPSFEKLRCIDHASILSFYTTSPLRSNSSLKVNQSKRKKLIN